MEGYTELQVTTNFSFLRGASHPEEMVQQAVMLGYTEIAITDRNSFAGIVRAHAEAKKAGIRIIPGCYIELRDGPPFLVYPVNIEGYAQICELLTTGNLRTEKGDCELYRSDAFDILKDVQIIVLPPLQLNHLFELDSDFGHNLSDYKKQFSPEINLAVHRKYHGDDSKLIYQMFRLSQSMNIPLVATNDVYYHESDRRQLQDILTCIREKCTINTAGFLLYPNAERYLKNADEMQRLFRQYPDVIRRTQEIASLCKFSLDELKYEYPEEITTEGRTPQEELIHLVWKGALEFFGEEVPGKIIHSIEHELEFIQQMDYAPYFLTVYDIVKFARSKSILCQGRGSAANSTVCFCLGITSVNPAKFDLLFERFLSAARNEPPDIDVDFEHERREEVIQYIYQKYGRAHAAIVATVTQQHQKGAIRDVAKAMGLSTDIIDKLSSSVIRYGGSNFEEEKLTELGMNAGDRLMKKTLSLTNQYIGFPRQLGQHTGGFVISRNKLARLCPVLNARMEDRTCLEWNKDDIEALGFLKIDVLALGMLTCIRKAFDLVKNHYGIDLTLANIPQDEPEVYEMICQADTIGVFQIESRAQQSMLPRLKPRCFYDLVIEVAIVRPGPIQGDMVHPYLRRRNGEEPVEFPSKELEEILGRTLGVPLFQEQAMKIAIVAAGFTPSEADQLRRSMATFKAKGLVTQFEKKLINGMTQKGYSLEYAKRVFRQLEGFGSYGFPESHAASFAQLVYVSSWLKYHYPDVFACALLNSLPMGFYQPAQIVTDAIQHGVEILPVDVNRSGWDNHLLPLKNKYCQLQLGLRNIKGVRLQDMDQLIRARGNGFENFNELNNAGLSDLILEKLADADAFGSMGLNRRKSLWNVSVQDKPKGMFSELPDIEKDALVQLPLMPMAQEVMYDYASLSLSLKAHPLSFIREQLRSQNAITAFALKNRKDGDIVRVAGLILVRQMPETAKGVCFITLEDETSVMNLIVFKNIFQQYKKEIVQSRVLMVEGKLQVEGLVIHVIVKKCNNVTGLMQDILSETQPLSMPALCHADEIVHLQQKDSRNKLTKSAIYGGRNFK